MYFHIEDDTLTIQFQGVERLWALRREIVVQKSSIVSATWQEHFVAQRGELGFRVGTAIPGSIFAGLFWSRQNKNFLYLQRVRGLFGPLESDHVLILALQDAPYTRLLLTVDDPDMAGQIIAWWASKS